MNPEFYRNVLQLLPDEALHSLMDATQIEIVRRNPPKGPDGRPVPSYQDLVDRYGKDGNRQLKTDNSSRMEQMQEETIPGSLVYLLSDLPFSANFDTELNMFVYTPTEKQLHDLRKGGGIISDNLEILIEPKLMKDSLIKYRIGTFIWNSSTTLEKFVEWYNESTKVDFNGIPYVGGVNESVCMHSHEGQEVITEVDWKGYTFQSAPFKVGTSVDIQSCSNIPRLIEDGVIPETALLERCPTVKSVFVEVGGALIRMMTGNIPYSRFVPSADITDRSTRLALRAAITITRNMKDCFGNMIPWTAVLGDEGLDLEISLHGSFNNQVGNMTMGKGVVDFTAHDDIGVVLRQFLKQTSKIMAYDLDASLLEH